MLILLKVATLILVRILLKGCKMKLIENNFNPGQNLISQANCRQNNMNFDLQQEDHLNLMQLY
jgi:hypothetical protein